MSEPGALLAARRRAAATPPLGWNSWDCFGGSVTEAEVLANAEFLAEHLLPLGWDTVVVDIQWAEAEPGRHGYNPVSDPRLDEFGRVLPAANRFPSAAGGSFKPLADRVHALGLKFGVHVMRGIPRKAVELGLPVLGTELTAADVADREHVCPWNPDNYGLDHAGEPAGAQAYYDSQLAQFAEWGVDFVKLDDVLYPPIELADIRAYSRAIDRSGRPMVLSLSPGRQLSTAYLDELREHAQLWRISDDFWDDWPQLREQFQRAARWAPLQQRGAWADADMLPLGRIGIRAHVGDDRLANFTLDEQLTMLTLWALLRSPLMLGGHLPDTPAETLGLLTRPGLAELVRRGANGREIVRDGALVIWATRVGGDDERGDDRADDDRGDEVRAVFWLGDEPVELTVHLADLGCSGATSAADFWSGAEIAIERDSVRLAVPAHGVSVLRMPRSALP